MDLAALDRFARAHHGVVSRDAALDRGATGAAWRRAIELGQVDRRFHRVVRLYGAPVTPEARIAAAVLAAGDAAVASHRSAARLWGVSRPDGDPVDVLLPSRNRRARLDDVRVHRPRDLAQLRPVWRDGMPATDPLRTLLDLGAVDASGVPAALTHMVTSGLVTPAAVRAVVIRHSRQGRHGIVALRAALDAWALGDRPADSELELRMAKLVERYRLPPMEFHARVGRYEVDFLVRGAPLVVECDGWASHGANRDQFEFDRRRDADLLALGFVTLRVTWRQVTQAPRATADRILRAVGALTRPDLGASGIP